MSDNKTTNQQDGSAAIYRLAEFGEKKAGEFNAFSQKVSAARKRLKVLYDALRERERAAAELKRAREAELKRVEDEKRRAEELVKKIAEDEKLRAKFAGENAPAERSAQTTPNSSDGSRPDGSRRDGFRRDDSRRDDSRRSGVRPDGVRPDGTRSDGVRSDGTPRFGAGSGAERFNRGDRPGRGAPGGGFAPGRPDGNRPDGSRPDANRPDGNRPAGTAGGGFRTQAGSVAAADKAQLRPSGNFGERRKDGRGGADEKKGMNKRTLIRKGYLMPDDADERMGSRKFRSKKNKEARAFSPVKIEKAVITTENLTVKILSEKIGKPANEILKQLMSLGIMANINGAVDFSTMELVAGELGVELELRLDKTKEEELQDIRRTAEGAARNKKRPPIVTVMGHVDHGKTSLLDALRKTSVAAGEAGGITQHIGAYTVRVGGEAITFLDTPGHEAFTEMRARGAKVTDVAVIVVAADDGVMPQTVEAINHAKSAGVSMIIAINKIDKGGADTDKIKQQLSECGVVPEDWGGDTIITGVSAKTGKGLDKLIKDILLVADMADLKADPSGPAHGAIIEAQLDKGRGPVATVVVQNGTLRVGDTVVAGFAAGKVRALLDDRGAAVQSAGPSAPVVVLGFTDVPNAGDTLSAVSDEKFSRQLTDERREKFRAGREQASKKLTLEEVLQRTGDSSKKLNVIIKADVQGSVEALRGALGKLSNDEVKINVVHGGVGAINKSDVMLADAAKAVIVGFNVKPDADAKASADNGGIEIKLYKIIYEATDDITAMAAGMLDPVYEERPAGRAEVRNLFDISGIGLIAGSYVTEGKIVRGGKARVLRGGEAVGGGDVGDLKRFKDDAKEVAAGYECGIRIEGFTTFKEGDIIEAYTVERVR